jgi:chromosome segregation ATPase
MDKKLTEEELQEISRFTEQFAHQTEDRKNVLSLLFRIEQLKEESASWRRVAERLEHEKQEQTQEIERLEGQLLELSESSYKNVMILMEQRNKANDECEKLGIKAQRLEEAIVKFTDKNLCSGSKSDREDYGVMVTCADIYELNQALKEVKGE